jgi:hypothetical protein
MKNSVPVYDGEGQRHKGEAGEGFLCDTFKRWVRGEGLEVREEKIKKYPEAKKKAVCRSEKS